MAIQFRHLEQENGVTWIVGHRMRAFDILDIQRHGATPNDIADDYSLPLGAVYEALAYAADHPEEMAAVEQLDRDACAEEVTRLRSTLDTRYDELTSGRVQPLDGAQVAKRLQESQRRNRIVRIVIPTIPAKLGSMKR